MSFESPSQRPIEVSKEIDSLCDAFEQGLRQGANPRIEDILTLIDEEHRGELFRELLEIEIDLRQNLLDGPEDLTSEKTNKSGRSTDRSGVDEDTRHEGLSRLPSDPESEYRRRFPQYSEITARVIRRVIRPRQLGDYELLREIGHGGMGVVYRAVQKYLNQIVAIKVLPKRYLDDPQAVNRFRREMFLIGSLNHPNIVRALNAGESDGTHYLVMEYVDGITVQALMRRAMERFSEEATDDSANGSYYYGDSKLTYGSPEPGSRKVSASALPPLGRMPLGAACEVIRQAALGLAHVHRFGLVHRDIKPANLMIDREGIVKILDLGLGKYHFGSFDTEAADTSLTKVGTMMGTTDYMAPEQWEDSGRADIRSDIYGLGCTFFFMATNTLPYGPPQYDTQRKKMSGHMLEPPPSLETLVDGVDDTLLDIFRRMMAKDPENRFQDPEDLAVELEPYANEHELLDFIDEVLRRPASGSDLRRGGTRSSTRLRKERRQTGLSGKGLLRFSGLPLFVAALCGVILAGVFALRTHAPMRIIPQPPESSAEDIATSRALQSRIRTTATELAQLPGLDGSWWFNDTAWYLPFVREALSRKLTETVGDVDLHEQDRLRERRNTVGDAADFTQAPLSSFDREAAETAFQELLDGRPEQYYDPNIVEVRQWLWRVVRNVRPALTLEQWRLVDDLKKLTEANLTRAESVEPLQEAFDRFDATKTLRESPKASDLHTKALLLHRLASLKSDKQLTLQADAVYTEALAAYKKEADANDATAARMQMFCMGDYARLLPLTSGQYDKSLEQFQRIVDLRDRRVVRGGLFYIDLLAAYGDTAMARGLHQDVLFDRALRSVANNPRLANRTHPLTAHVRERSAWNQIDQWRVEAASADFMEALRIRETNFKETVRDPDTHPFARIYIFHNKHGLAMTYRYLGNADRAQEEYETVLKGLHEELNRIGAIEPENRFPGYFRYRLLLSERCGNTHERSGDCVLYGGAASGRAAPSALTRASTDYERARDLSPYPETRRVMACKLAMIKAMQKRYDEAVQILRDSDRENRIVLGNVQRGDLLRRVADAVVLAGENPDEACDRLRTLLNQFRFDLNNKETIQRETLEVRIFCAEYLIHAMLQRDDTKQAVLDLSNLFLPIVVSFGDRPEMRPFLRPYFDLAIRACTRSYENAREPERLSNIAELIWRARSRKESVSSSGTSGAEGTPTPNPEGFPAGGAVAFASGSSTISQEPTTLLLFHFTDDRRDGIAVFFPRDGRAARLFAVPYTREEIRNAETLALDTELVELIDRERRAGPGVNISWADDVCWARPKDALTDEDWPFANQLKLHLAPPAEP